MRKALVDIVLEWERCYGVAPQITSTISEYDAAMLVGMPEQEYSIYMQGRTARQKGYDFEFNRIRYQIKGTRTSEKKGSEVTRVPEVKNYEWDLLIWINYDKKYNMIEAWQWKVEDYRREFEQKIEQKKGTTCTEIRREGEGLGERLYLRLDVNDRD